MKPVTVKMLKSCQKSLASKWKKLSPGQAVYQGVNDRLLLANKKLSFLEGLNVLDIGCNQALHSVVLSQICPTVVGLEVNKGAFKRAVATRDWFADQGFKMNNLSLYNKELIEFKNYQHINAILACCVIYNMDDNNIEHFMNILKNCNRIIYQTRPSRYSQVEGRSKYLNKICKVEDVVSLLKEEGFAIDSIDGENTRWPVICGFK